MTKLGQAILRGIEAAGLCFPESLTIMVTPKCNLYCRHCWLDCLPASRGDAIPAPAILKWIHEFIALGGNRIILAGGEPLCHPQWFDILQTCCEVANLEQVCLQTNGTLLTPEAVSLLRQLPADRLTIQVSLDGAEAPTHDHVRGSGSFTRTLQGIHRLVNAGMGKQMRLTTTEMLHNLEDLPALLELAETLNIPRVIGNTLVKGGRAYRNKSVDLPLPSQYLELIGRYQTDRRFKDLYHKRGNIAAIEWFKGRQTPTERVCSCIQNLFITAEKVLYPCIMFLHPEYAVSLYDKQTLQGAVAEALARWARLPKISERRSREMTLCKACPGRKHCAGGCMGRAYATFDDLMSVEDRCGLRKAVYTWKRPPQT